MSQLRIYYRKRKTDRTGTDYKITLIYAEVNWENKREKNKGFRLSKMVPAFYEWTIVYAGGSIFDF